MENGERRRKQKFRIDPSLRKGFKLDDVVVLPQSGAIICHGQHRHLPPKAMEVLLFLCQNHNRLISTEKLLAFGWGDVHANRANLTHVISEIRQALDDHKECPAFIQTIPKKGYRLIAKVAPGDEKVLYPNVWPLQSSPKANKGVKKDSHWHLSLAVFKNSKLFSVSIAFLVSIWVIIQIFDIVFPIFNVPEWGLKLAVLILVVGLPLTLLYTWLKEIKIKKVLLNKQKDNEKKRFFYRQLAVDFGFIGLMSLAVGWLSFYLIESIESDASLVEIEETKLTIPVQDDLIAIPAFRFEENVSAPKYFKATLQNELIHALSNQKDFKLVSQRAVNELPFDTKLSDYATRLGARYLLDGRVFGDKQEIKILISFIDTLSAHQIWSSDVSGKTSDLLNWHKEINRQIFNALSLLNEQKEFEPFAVINTDDFKAYDNYIQGKNSLVNVAESGHLKTAELYFLEALKIDPKFSLALAGLCQTYLDQYLDTSSLTIFNSATETCSGLLSVGQLKEEGYIALADLNRIKGEHDSAIELYQKALGLDEFNLFAISGLAQAKTSLGEYDEATELFKKMLKIEPGYWRNYQRFGNFLFNLGNYELASEQFKKLTLLRPDWSTAFNSLGAAYFMSVRTDAATKAWRRSLELEPSAENYSNLGTVLFFSGDYEAAIINHQSVIALNKNNPIFWINLAEAQKYAGKSSDSLKSFASALEAADRKLSVNPTDYSNLGTRARVNSELGNCEQAMDTVNKYEVNEWTDPYFNYDLSLAALNCGDKQRALANISNALGIGYPFQLLEKDVQFASIFKQIKSMHEED